ncbi:hypothetical protein P691DRAFT_766900 [Macrolepiota fuliginosa MF-IS2]|uniref:Uncharacterized protein n=1 Tax=Macrolepiota fuliginosa MF-IS2 TaxID=1400762 RepID=A0A9P6BVP9_9AGAR|nr:hypothetical protein P691DRAFT_766900 [Macrolepiota fuliginosa MF-IS2]
MPPSPESGSPPPANMVELPAYGANPVLHQLASFSQDQWATLKAQVYAMQLDKVAMEEVAKVKAVVSCPCPRPVTPVQAASSPKVVTPKAVVSKVAVSQLVSVPPAPLVTGSPVPVASVSLLDKSPSPSPVPEPIVEDSSSPLPVPRFKRRRGVLSPPTDVVMVSPPPATPAPLFFSEEEDEPSPPPPSQPSLHKQSRVDAAHPMAAKIPRSMELQDVAAKAHKKVTLKLPPLPTLVPTISTVAPPSSLSVLERAKVRNNEEFVCLCGIAVPAPVLSGAQHLFAVPSPEVLGPLSSESPPCATCLYQHQECMKHQSQTNELDHQKLTAAPPSPEEVSNILHLPACATCTKKGIPHCSCSKPVPLAQYQAEMLCTASISSFSSLHTCMCNIHVSWSQIQGQELLLQMAITSHHSQVSEFAADLVVAQAYHSNDPNYWVNSGLVASREDAQQLFKAAHKVVEHPASGMDPTTATHRLYHAQGRVVCFCSTACDEAPPFWAALPKLATFMDHHQQAQSLMGLAKLPPDTPDYVPSGINLPALMYQPPPKDQAWAQHHQEQEKRAPASKAVIRKAAPKPAGKPSVPQVPAQPKASSSRVTLEEGEEEEEDLSS